MIKCDLHVHSNASDAVLQHAFAKLCGVRECYSEPEEIYRIEKERGMGAFTVTDHIVRLDSARAAFDLAKKYPKDCFTGGEYMIKDPETGFMLEAVCCDYNETQHEELFRLAQVGPEAFIEYAQKQKLPCSLVHCAWPVAVKQKLNPEAIDKWTEMFPLFETINGDLERANDIAILFAKKKGLKPVDNSGRRWWKTTGGGDAHLLSGLGRAYTVAPKARNKKDFLEALRAGEVYGEGEYSSLALFNDQIYEGISAYMRHEWHEMKRLGFREYAIKYPNKLVYMSLIPAFRPILPLAIATNLRTRLEEQSYDLEQKVIDYILKQEFKEEKMEIHERIEKRKAELKAGTKKAGYYLPLPNGIRARIVEKVRTGWNLADAEYEPGEQESEEESSPAQYLVPLLKMAEPVLKWLKLENLIEKATGGSK